jgi:hypothetical protein
LQLRTSIYKKDCIFITLLYSIFLLPRAMSCLLSMLARRLSLHSLAIAASRRIHEVYSSLQLAVKAKLRPDLRHLTANWKGAGGSHSPTTASCSGTPSLPSCTPGFLRQCTLQVMRSNSRVTSWSALCAYFVHRRSYRILTD